jgi:protein-S-isoprenylcysteine O-methyltransferase Ste14
MSKSYAELAARIRVPCGLLLGVVYILFAQPTPERLLWGSAVALAGLLLRAAGAGHLAKNRKLATSGPYAYTRHPLYMGSALAGIGFCIAGGRWWFLLLLGFFLFAVYWPVIRREESHLAQLFPGEFSSYARAVPFLFPVRRAVPAGDGESIRFSWKLYWKNREYRAFLAYVAIMVVLLGKLLLLARS